METIFSVVIIILALGLIVYFFRDRISVLFEQEDDHGFEEKYQYKKKEFLLNVPERRFFEELQKIIPSNYSVFPQVVLSNIVNVDSSREEFYKYRNKINKKTIDFVVFEKPYFKPFLAIEYDGRTHNYQNRKERDYEVNKILERCGIKIIHVKHQENINFETILDCFKNKLE